MRGREAIAIMKSKLITRLLNDKKYRKAYVASQIKVGIPFQIKAMREKREWSQGQLADMANMLQPRISAMEKAGHGSPNIETLLRLAAAFDIGLVVKFAPFSELVSWGDKFSPDTFNVPSIENDMALESGTSGASTNANLIVVGGTDVSRIQPLSGTNGYLANKAVIHAIQRAA